MILIKKTYLLSNRLNDCYVMIMILNFSNHSFEPANELFDYRQHLIPLIVPYGPILLATIPNDYLRLEVLESVKNIIPVAILLIGCF